MTRIERELLIFNVADELACNCGYGTPAFRKRFLEQARATLRKAFDRYDAKNEERSGDQKGEQTGKA